MVVLLSIDKRTRTPQKTATCGGFPASPEIVATRGNVVRLLAAPDAHQTVRSLLMSIAVNSTRDNAYPLGIEIEPYFAAEARKPYKATVGRPSQSVENVPQREQARSRDQTAAAATYQPP